MTTVLSATLAAKVRTERLVLFHLSARYPATEWRDMLQEAQQVFPQTAYPVAWNII
jgi:ribonuclease BN (tRNA processing enzyme)